MHSRLPDGHHLGAARHVHRHRRALAAGRAYAAADVSQWTDPRWQASARAYFAAERVDAELRPATGPWFSTLAGPGTARVQPADKFVVTSPGHASVLLGSGAVVPRTTTTRSGWFLPLAAGAFVLALTVAAAGAFLGRHVVRPLSAIAQATRTVPFGETDLHLPVTRVGEVSTVVTALQTMSDNLHAALDKQADMEEQRRQFIGAIAHDLRTPLFTLRAYLDGLSEGLAVSPEKTSQYLQACRTSAHALDQLVTDLFSYARMEYLGQQPCRETVDLGVLLRTAAQAHQPRAEAKQVTVTVTAAAAPCAISADEYLLSRAIGNLIDNALRYTPEHGRIELHCARTDSEAVFTVTDTGPGIAPADLPNLFTPIYRGESSRNRATGGTGLGLTIAHRIMLGHDGTLTAENATPAGARFTGRIPAVPSSRSPHDPAPPTT